MPTQAPPSNSILVRRNQEGLEEREWRLAARGLTVTSDLRTRTQTVNRAPSYYTLSLSLLDSDSDLLGLRLAFALYSRFRLLSFLSFSFRFSSFGFVSSRLTTQYKLSFRVSGPPPSPTPPSVQLFLALRTRSRAEQEGTKHSARRSVSHSRSMLNACRQVAPQSKYMYNATRVLYKVSTRTRTRLCTVHRRVFPSLFSFSPLFSSLPFLPAQRLRQLRARHDVRARAPARHRPLAACSLSFELGASCLRFVGCALCK